MENKDLKQNQQNDPTQKKQSQFDQQGNQQSGQHQQGGQKSPQSDWNKDQDKSRKQA